jgi:glycerol-3-phosphate acyltransferase PlsY
MILYLTIISLVLAYIAGSIPTAVWTGKLFHGIDVREHGSGNAGATNTIRVLGWKSGIPVMIVDLAKGWLGASLPVMLNAAPEGSSTLLALQIACGMAAIIGHVFPIMAGFRGGKGVATTFGVLLALHPALTLSCAAVFLVVLLLTGYVSLSSMTAGIMFPILLMTVFETPSLLFKVFSVLIAIALLLTHYKNIGRLLKGEEKRFIRKGKG